MVGYDAANQTAYLDDMLRWGLDWLIKAHPSENTLFIQVGDSSVDNAYWGGDQSIPTPRQSFQINSTRYFCSYRVYALLSTQPLRSPGTDAAAQASAAFSACSALYGNHALSSTSSPASLANGQYASTLLTHAQQLYKFATTAPQRTYQTSVPASADAYASSGYNDDLSLAAMFLALASNSSDLYSQGVDYYVKNGLSKQIQPANAQVLNWDSKTPGVVILGAQLENMYPDLIANAASKSNFANDAETYLDAIVRAKVALT